GLFRYLFPDTDRSLEARPQDAELIQKALVNTDNRIEAGKSVTPMFLFGVFLWGPVRDRAAELQGEGVSEMQALIEALGEIASQQAQRIALPRRFGFPMREMLQLQPRFATKRGRRAMSLLNHRRFRAAYDLMLLRAEVGEVDEETASFWTTIQEVTEEEQRQRFGLGNRPGQGNRPGRPGRKRRRAKPAD
ncbi:MAG: polynucleotide adenylyltransferase PcnB, partial [Gammaproteobacteria bacterium]|nr:polynucleotide adenylyltransferase PcnB [Gammaproteobacteria bacterium]